MALFMQVAEIETKDEESAMTEHHLAPRHVAPYLVSGATSLHILVRMWRLSRLPASDTPLPAFLLNHADVLLVLGSGPMVVWHIAKRHRLHQLPAATANAERSLLAHSAHQLRQVFTALLIGLGLISRKATTGRMTEIPPLVKRLQQVVAAGIEAVNALDPPAYPSQPERAVNEE